MIDINYFKKGLHILNSAEKIKPIIQKESTASYKSVSFFNLSFFLNPEITPRMTSNYALPTPKKNNLPPIERRKKQLFSDITDFIIPCSKINFNIGHKSLIKSLRNHQSQKNQDFSRGIEITSRSIRNRKQIIIKHSEKLIERTFESSPSPIMEPVLAY